MGVNVGVCPVDDALLSAVTLFDDDVVAVERAIHRLEEDMSGVPFWEICDIFSTSVMGSSFFSVFPVVFLFLRVSISRRWNCLSLQWR